MSPGFVFLLPGVVIQQQHAIEDLVISTTHKR